MTLNPFGLPKCNRIEAPIKDANLHLCSSNVANTLFLGPHSLIQVSVIGTAGDMGNDP